MSASLCFYSLYVFVEFIICVSGLSRNDEEEKDEETTPSGKGKSKEEVPKAELPKSISQLQNYVFMQEYQGIFNTLVELEEKHIQKVKLVYILRSITYFRFEGNSFLTCVI